MTDTESAEQKIIVATIQLLGTEGMNKLTIRRVAERSQVNVAAINYYFRTKENLINQALQHYAQLTQRVFGVLADESLPPYRRLRAFLARFSMHLITYPGFMKSIFMRTMNGETIALQAQESMQRGRAELMALVQNLSNEEPEVLSLKIFQLMGGLLYPIVWGTYANDIYHIDFHDPVVRERYIDTLIHSFFPEIGPEAEHDMG